MRNSPKKLLLSPLNTLGTIYIVRHNNYPKTQETPINTTFTAQIRVKKSFQFSLRNLSDFASFVTSAWYRTVLVTAAGLLTSAAAAKSEPQHDLAREMAHAFSPATLYLTPLLSPTWPIGLFPGMWRRLFTWNLNFSNSNRIPYRKLRVTKGQIKKF